LMMQKQGTNHHGADQNQGGRIATRGETHSLSLAP
jgi:hypothetical protein